MSLREEYFSENLHFLPIVASYISALSMIFHNICLYFLPLYTFQNLLAHFSTFHNILQFFTSYHLLPSSSIIYLPLPLYINFHNLLKFHLFETHTSSFCYIPPHPKTFLRHFTTSVIFVSLSIISHHVSMLTYLR